MLQVKVFEAPDAEELEQNVNDWLESNISIDVLNMTQSESAISDDDGDLCGNVTLTLMYRQRA